MGADGNWILASSMKFHCPGRWKPEQLPANGRSQKACLLAASVSHSSPLMTRKSPQRAVANVRIVGRDKGLCIALSWKLWNRSRKCVSTRLRSVRVLPEQRVPRQSTKRTTFQIFGLCHPIGSTILSFLLGVHLISFPCIFPIVVSPHTQDELTVAEKRLISQMADQLQERGQNATSSAVMVRLQAKHPEAKVAANRVRRLLRHRKKVLGLTTSKFKDWLWGRASETAFYFPRTVMVPRIISLDSIVCFVAPGVCCGLNKDHRPVRCSTLQSGASVYCASCGLDLHHAQISRRVEGWLAGRGQHCMVSVRRLHAHPGDHGIPIRTVQCPGGTWLQKLP